MVENNHDIVNIENGTLRLTKDGRLLFGQYGVLLTPDYAWTLAEMFASVATGVFPSNYLWLGMNRLEIVRTSGYSVTLWLFGHKPQQVNLTEDDMWHLIKGLATLYARNMHRVTTVLVGDTMMHVSLKDAKLILTCVDDGDMVCRRILGIKETALVLAACKTFVATAGCKRARATQEVAVVTAEMVVADTIMVVGKTEDVYFISLALSAENVAQLASAA